MFGRRVLQRVGADPYRDVRVCVCVCVCVQGFGLMLNVAATDGVKQISVLASMSQRPRDPGDMRLLAVRIACGIAITSCADATCGSAPCGFIVQHDDGSPVNHVLRYTWVY